MYLALRKLGLKVKLPLVGGSPNGQDALLKCNRTTQRRAGVKQWHWCVWSAAEQRVLDPLDDGKSRPILAHMPVGRVTDAEVQHDQRSHEPSLAKAGA
jgi:hypothetical protein